MPARSAFALTASVVVLGCGGDDEVRTVTVQNENDGRSAYAEMEQQARKTCAVVPRDVLVESFRSVSEDRAAYTGRRLTPNDIALLYAEDVAIRPLRLQRAAYDGCIAGLKRGP